MASKTISISEDAYQRLSRLKREGESFTEVIQRVTGGADLERFAGSISPDFADELRRFSQAFRERFDEDARRRSR